MAERAANLVDHVLPAVPMRQWVLSLLFRLRYLLAWNHELCREVLAVYVRALRGFYRRRARRAGIRDAETGRRSSLRDVVTRGYTVPVKTSVRATKARLSELLDRVASGEEIVITSAGKPKAKLIPVGPAPKPFRVNRRLLAMRPKKRHRPAEMLVRDDRDARD
jgi:prevent-host-death family protein